MIRGFFAWLLFSIIGFLFVGILTADAKVWETREQWSEAWEEEYRNWIRSEHFHRSMFVDKNSPFYGVRTDCADYVFSARIIFSYLNGLPFSLKNPSGERDGNSTLVSNELNIWDANPNSNERVRAFIHYIGDTVGTDHLARQSTFPVIPKQLKSGDAYVYTSVANHSYIIKDVLPTGNQVLWFSTTPKAVRHISKLTGVPGKSFNSAPWGYRRFRWPEHLGLPSFKIPRELGAGDDQYSLVNKVGESSVLSAIKNEVRTTNENLEAELLRRIENICNRIQDRQAVIEDAINYVKSQGGRCLSRGEYDGHSTPSRDSQLSLEIQNLIATWQEALEEKIHRQLPHDLRRALNYIARTRDETSSGFNSRKKDYPYARKLCVVPTNLAGLTEIDIAYVTDKRHRFSSHPNDNIYRRWGLNEGKPTRCPDYTSN